MSVFLSVNVCFFFSEHVRTNFVASFILCIKNRKGREKRTNARLFELSTACLQDRERFSSATDLTTLWVEFPCSLCVWRSKQLFLERLLREWLWILSHQ